MFFNAFLIILLMYISTYIFARIFDFLSSGYWLRIVTIENNQHSMEKNDRESQQIRVNEIYVKSQYYCYQFEIIIVYDLKEAK